MLTQRRTLICLAGCVAWTLFGALSALQIHVRELTSGGQSGLRSVFNIVYFYWAWALLTPAVIRLAPRIDDTDMTWPATVIRQLLRAAAVIVTQTVLYTCFLVFDGRVRASDFIGAIPSMLIRHLAGNLLTYLMLVSAWVGLAFYRRARARELAASQQAQRSSELEAALARTQLHALQSQLQPHFLFNTLNMISTLVARREPVVANRAIARLGDLLRVALHAQETQQVPLDEEIAVTRHYVEIVEMRFGDRVQITFALGDDARTVLVPTLLLQPLIENAVRHGVSAGDRPVMITVTARLTHQTIVIVVSDDGAGFSDPSYAGRRGRGLENIRQRIHALHGTGASLELGNRSSGGAVVTVTLPVDRVARTGAA